MRSVGVQQCMSADAQHAFKAKFKLPFTVLADLDGVVTKAFGVPSTGSFANREAFRSDDASSRGGRLA